MRYVDIRGSCDFRPASSSHEKAYRHVMFETMGGNDMDVKALCTISGSFSIAPWASKLPVHRVSMVYLGLGVSISPRQAM